MKECWLIASSRVAAWLVLTICVGLAMAADSSAQTHSVADYATMPSGLAPGAPAGSYSLSEVESINPYNGGLNVTLPLLKVGGRGGAGYTIMVRPKTTTWTVATRLVGFGCGGSEDDNPCQIWEAGARKEWWTPVEPGYDPGVVQGHYVSSEPDSCPDNPNNPFYTRRFTVLTFTAPDGSEHYLYDEQRGGQVVERRICSEVPDSSRGHVFSSKDGSGLTFITDDEILDDEVPDGYPAQALFWPAGYLKTADGSVYRFTWGRAEWMRDRNGNQITFAYGTPTGPTPAHRRMTKVTDSLGREVNVAYDASDPQYGVHDRIEYKGFGGATRVIRVAKTALSNAFRPGSNYQRKRIKELFPQLPLSSADYFDPQVVSAVWLADGVRHFQLYYNEYNEVERLELPTGAAVEYDHWAGIAGPWSGGTAYPSGQFGYPVTIYGEPKVAIYRRLKERRLYPNGGNTYSLKTSYSRAVSVGEWRTCVTVDQVDASDGDRLLTRHKHYYQGDAGMSIFGSLGGVNDGVNDPIDAKEYLTQELPTDGGTTPLKEVETTWERGNTGGPPDATPWSAFVSEVVVRLFVASTGQFLVAKKSYAYDRYNNQTDVYEYDFGSVRPTRHVHADYLTSDNDTAYTGYNGAHLRHLPRAQQLYEVDQTDGTETLLAQSEMRYDEVAFPLLPCGTAEAPVDCSSAIQWVNPGTAPRGNVTTARQWLNTDNIWLETHTQFDQLGNLRKAWDARDVSLTNPTRIDYVDAFSDGVVRNTFALATRTTSPVPDATGQNGSASPMVATSVYDFSTGAVRLMTDYNGTVTAALYDDTFDRLTQVERAVNVPALHNQTTYDYDDDTRTITTTKDLKSFGDNLLKSEYMFDGLGRTTESRRYETPAQYISAVRQYDALGREAKVSNPYRPNSEAALWTKTDYDAMGRVTLVTTADGAKVYKLYDGSRTLVVDQAGRQRISETDGLGRLTDVWEIKAADAATEQVTFPTPVDFPHQPPAAGYRTSYVYDARGALLKVEQGEQPRYFVYDSLSRLIRVRNPEQDARPALALPSNLLSPLSDNYNEWSLAYVYDRNGNLQSATDARGVVTGYSYDGLNRIKTRAYSGLAGDTTPAVTYTYDDPAVANARGLLTKVSSAQSTYSYTAFDELGRVRGSAQLTDGVSYSMPDYRYDLAGNLTSEKYPSGRVMHSEYDGAGRLAGVKGEGGDYYAGGDATIADNPAVIKYAAHGAVSTLKLGNGLWEQTQYNSRLQIWQIGLGSSPTDSGVIRLDYAYGEVRDGALDLTRNNGNVQSQTITAPGGAPYVQTYSYDALNRIESAEETVTNWKQVYAYDRYGNRTLATGTTYPAQLNAVNNPAVGTSRNRFTSAGYSYDPMGNLVCDLVHQCVQGQTVPTPYFEYDAENRIKTAGGAPAAGGTTYTYDGDGRRVMKVSGAIKTVFVYNAAGALVAEYGGLPSQSTGTSYVTQDLLGSTRVVTGQNPSDVRARYDYLPFGEALPLGRSHYEGNDDIKQKFTGKERDDETGLDYFGARYYSSSLGRFTSPDPMLTAGRPVNPQTWNRYAYTLGNPLRYIDPDGFWEWDSSLGGSKSTEELEKSKDQNERHQAEMRRAFMAALQRAKTDAARTLSGEKLERVNKALDAYGKSDTDKNGVTVGVGGKTSEAKPGVTTSSYTETGASIRVTFHENVLGGTSNWKAVYTIAHEGEHVKNARDFGTTLKDMGVAKATGSAANITDYQDEYRAHEVLSYMLEANRQEGVLYGSAVWQNGWSKLDERTQNDVRREAINKVLAADYEGLSEKNQGRRKSDYVRPSP